MYLQIHFFFFSRFEKNDWRMKKSRDLLYQHNSGKKATGIRLLAITHSKMEIKSKFMLCLGGSAPRLNAWLETIHTWHEWSLLTFLLWQILTGSIKSHSGTMICHLKDIWMSLCLLSLRAFKTSSRYHWHLFKEMSAKLADQAEKNV